MSDVHDLTWVFGSASEEDSWADLDLGTARDSALNAAPLTKLGYTQARFPISLPLMRPIGPPGGSAGGISSPGETFELPWASRPTGSRVRRFVRAWLTAARLTSTERLDSRSERQPSRAGASVVLEDFKVNSPSPWNMPWSNSGAPGGKLP